MDKDLIIYSGNGIFKESDFCGAFSMAMSSIFFYLSRGTFSFIIKATLF